MLLSTNLKDMIDMLDTATLSNLVAMTVSSE